MTKRPGFTLIELLTTMAIIGILAALSVPSYAAIRQSVEFGAAADQVVAALKTAENQSLTGQDGSHYHVLKIDSATTYELNNGTTTTQTYSLSGGITIAGSNITFYRLTNTTSGGTITLTSGGRTKTISVDVNGRFSQS